MAEPSKQAERTYLGRIIAGARLFAGVAADDVAELARHARGLAVARGKTIAAPKGKDDEVFIIEKGAAAFLDRDPATGRSVLVALMGPGEVIGLARAAEAMNGDQASRTGEWRALSNLTLVAIPMPEFVRVLRRSDELSAACLGSIARSLRQVTARFTASLQYPLEMRLAAFLEELGAIASGKQWEPTVNIGRLQQTQIAEMLSVSREHINRTLIMWEKSGLIFQARSGEIVIENRKRLSQLAGARRPANVSGGDNDRLWEIEAHINHGLNAAAYDLAMEGVKRSPKDGRCKYLAVLAMARMGALSEALSLAETFKLSTDATDEDIASIGPRLRRDLAFAAPEGPDQTQLKAAAEGYEKVFRALKTTYPGVNAAATYAMSGDLGLAKKIAVEVCAKAEAALTEIDADEPSYWSRATLAECRLIGAGAATAAADFASAANAVDAAPGKIATTRTQLRRLKSALNFDDAWVDRILPLGPVLYFCGPLTPSAGNGQPALNRLKKRVAEFVSRRPIVGAVGALAAGADIVIAETLIEAGVPLHAHLPLPPTEFLASSVAPAGGDWRERYIACIERAQTVDWMRRAKPSRAAYRLGARVAIGRAIRQAGELATEPFGFFALQRGRTAQNSVSIENAEIWRSLGLDCEFAEDDWFVTSDIANTDAGRTYLAALVIQGGDPDAIARAVEPAPLFSRRANGLVIFGFERAMDALEAAQQISRAPFAGALRMWLDAGIGERDEAKSADFESMLVTAISRPQTAPGKTYASETFVHAATSAVGQKPHFEYVGYAPTEEKVDPCPLYLVGI